MTDQMQKQQTQVLHLFSKYAPGMKAEPIEFLPIITKTFSFKNHHLTEKEEDPAPEEDQQPCCILRIQV